MTNIKCRVCGSKVTFQSQITGDNSIIFMVLECGSVLYNIYPLYDKAIMYITCSGKIQLLTYDMIIDL